MSQEQEGSVTPKFSTAGFEDGGSVHEPKAARNAGLEAGKGKKTVLP